MPRRAWIADLQKLQQQVDIARIQSVRPGEDDGEVIISIKPDGNHLPAFSVCALIPDLGDYPTTHFYHIFAADDAPTHVGTTLEQDTSPTSGLNLTSLCAHLSRLFGSHQSDADGDTVMIDSQLPDEESSDEDDFPGYESDEMFHDGATRSLPTTAVTSTSARRRSSLVTSAYRRRIRNDLRLVKGAGFRVGHHAALMEGGSSYVSISIRVNKLGISDEALQAWQLTGKEYLILLIHFSAGYRTLDDLEGLEPSSARTLVDFRVCCSNAYKPSITETICAFTSLAKNESERPTTGLRDIFISKALNQLFNDRFIMILRYRGVGLTWTAAEKFYNQNQGRSMSATGSDFLTVETEENEVSARPFPGIVLDDHFTTTVAPRSLPLVAVQFLLRHFVRCTEFCLVCHCKLPGDLEAIKPYVCEAPLCLYQYMSLGFGPSIEHEILTQPYVVDLLLSFCYSSAASQKLKELPHGLSLNVPPIPPITKPTKASDPSDVAILDRSINAKWEASSSELIFAKDAVLSLKVGDWIVMSAAGLEEVYLHGRVNETIYFPTVKLGQLKVIPEPGSDHLFVQSDNFVPNKKVFTKAEASAQKELIQRLTQKERRDVWFSIYKRNFDDLSNDQQQATVRSMIELLPRVQDMKNYLAKNNSLAAWVDQISPAALGILRWVIASNRACIMQSADDERVYGMNGWMEFRFAMGAPDKERRFVNAVNATHTRLSQKHPTIFAFHGSPLHNWHSIIRQGLHFNDVAHGRAYGNGVYHSLDYNTSAGYSGHHYYGGVDTSRRAWHNSDLRVQTAMAVNELVNAPSEYVSRSPHLVVAQLDWIQTRFLFVRLNTDQDKVTISDVVASSDPFPQDPQMTPRGEKAALIIPRTAIPRVKEKGAKKVDRRSTLTKLLKSKKDDDISHAMNADEGYASAATDTEDLQILEDSEDECTATAAAVATLTGRTSTLVALGKSITNAKQTAQTDFVAGVLDHSTLPMMGEPSYSTPAATRRLQKDFQGLVRIQETTPLHELGWYTDPNKFENVYQWIVELHSFEESLPLAKAMKAQRIKSIVLEMRFGPDYPMSPPFVRVIRPRFMSFQQGGGGHVTLGGSLCMELLTNTGWTVVSSIESVLLSIRLALTDRERPAKLETHGRGTDYGIHEAVDAYERACRTHNWQIPPDFRKMALTGGTSDDSM